MKDWSGWLPEDAYETGKQEAYEKAAQILDKRREKSWDVLEQFPGRQTECLREAGLMEELAAEMRKLKENDAV